MLEDYIRNLASRFSDDEEAYCRLDSIAYSGTKNGVTESILKDHLGDACEVSLLYGDKQLNCLSVIDRVYAEGISNKGSFLFVSITRQSMALREFH